MRRIILAAISTILLSGPVHAAEKDPFLDHLSGVWVTTGTIEQKATIHDIKAEWVVQNEYLRLTEVSREKDAAGKPQYEAEVLIGYDPAKQRYVCFWFDNTGIASPNAGGIALRTGDALPFIFKSAGGDFRNTMTYDAKSDSWTWLMAGEQNGKLVPFAELALKRH